MSKKCILLLLLFSCLAIRRDAVAELGRSGNKETVDQVIEPLMREYGIPGMAVAVTFDGQTEFYNYGVASRETRQPITDKTLFEIGSITKTFTATLTSYAVLSGDLSLSDSASKHLPILRGSSFDRISLLDLGTHTTGGLPMQVPENIRTSDELMDYLKHWQPPYAVGARRTYSNVGIGLLGLIAAGSMRLSFEDAMEKQILSPLGMTNSYLRVPTDQGGRYAQGYTTEDRPVRMSPGILGDETYGIKSCSSDMIRFVIANLQLMPAESPGEDGKLLRAVNATHTGYFTVGEMTQDLVWEQYPYPVELERVLAGNSPSVITDATVAAKLGEPLPPQTNVLINKTGSTNGFGAYVAFIPAKKLGIVILANKRYDIAARVMAAHEILTHLDRKSSSPDR